MDANRKLEVELLGQKFVVGGDVGSEHLIKVVQYVKEQIQQVEVVNRNANPVRLALLATMNIASAHLQLQEQSATLKTEVAQRTEKLLKLLDEMSLQ